MKILLRIIHFNNNFVFSEMFNGRISIRSNEQTPIRATVELNFNRL